MDRRKKAVRRGKNRAAKKNIHADSITSEKSVKRDSGEEIEIFEQWLYSIQPCIEDFGLSPVPDNLYSLTQAVSLICDRRGIEAGPFWDVCRALIASVRPDPEGWAGPKPDKAAAVDAFRQAHTLYGRLVALLVEETRNKAETRTTKPLAGKTKRKLPQALHREALEKYAAKELTKNPDITCMALAEVLQCNKSTVVRLLAWQHRGALDYPKPAKGFVKQDEDGVRTGVEPIDDGG